MKRFVRSSGEVLLLAPLVALAACIAPAQDLGDPWPAGGDAATDDPWAWGGEPAGQPTREQLEPASAGGDGAATTALPDRTEPPLLSWDGGVVDGPSQGEVTEMAGNGRNLGRPGDRFHIIELYEQALDERDQLANEVATLSAALERAYALLDQSEKNGLALTNQVGTTGQELERLQKENQDLAARLATAQIRRLEAEKMLLEVRIEAYRRQNAKAGDLAMGDGQ